MTKTTYLILAGGHSTRVPGKIYLSQIGFGCEPLFLSAVNIADQACDEDRDQIIVLVAPGQESTVTRMCSGYDVRVDTDNHSGIVQAVRSYLSPTRRLVVLCGDNVYGPETAAALQQEREGCWVSVQTLSLDRQRELDGYDRLSSAWVSRGMVKDVALTTPWVFSPGTTIPAIATTVPYALNEVHAVPVTVDDPEWRDLGTPEEVRRYYEGR